MENRVLYSNEPGEFLSAHIIDIPDWDGFDKLIAFVQMYYSAEVIDQIDGPGVRIWKLKSQGYEYHLIHNDGYGNYFVAPTLESKAIVEEIGKDLEARLASLHQ